MSQRLLVLSHLLAITDRTTLPGLELYSCKLGYCFDGVMAGLALYLIPYANWCLLVRSLL